jgi:hypothetical protein
MRPWSSGIPTRRDSESRLAVCVDVRTGVTRYVSSFARDALQPPEDDRLQRDSTIGEAVVTLHGCVLERSGAIFPQRCRQTFHVSTVLIVGCHDQHTMAPQDAGPAPVIPLGCMPRRLGEECRRRDARNRA